MHHAFRAFVVMRAGGRSGARAMMSVAATGAVLAAVAVRRGGEQCSAAAVANTCIELDDMYEDVENVSRETLYERSKKAALRDPDDGRLLWRCARAAHALHDEVKDPKRKKELIDEALRFIRDAKAKERNDNNVFRWSGIILSTAGTYSSTTDYIKNAFVIRDDWEQATYINPYDASALHLLGRWHYDVASMSWITRKAAATFFAEPPSATYEEALGYFKRAEDTSPGFWKKNQTMLAETELRLGHKDKALEWAKAAVRLPTRTEDDRKAHAEALRIYKQLDPAGHADWVKREAEDAKAREEEKARELAAKVAGDSGKRLA